MGVPSLRRALNKPYYVFRPSQLARRLARTIRRRNHEAWETVRLPWGLDIAVQSDEAIGSSIVRTGVFELPVSEAIWRLIDSGDLAVDVGANVGYMTSLMASRVGSLGRVVALEPHPTVFTYLTDNVHHWLQAPAMGHITLHNLAASDQSGTARLYMHEEFDRNMGTATLHPCPSASQARTSEARAVQVELARLDTLIGAGDTIGILKVDVEGHELSVFHGAHNLLSSGRIRDILFEEVRPLPTPVSQLLESYGYQLYGLEQRLGGLGLSPADGHRAIPPWDAPTYLGTIDASRALSRVAQNGWKVLRPRRS